MQKRYFEYECCHRVDRQNIPHNFFTVYVDCLAHSSTGTVDRGIQVTCHLLPIRFGSRFHIESVTNKVKSNIVRQCDFYFVKTLLNNRPWVVFITAVIPLGEGRQGMRNNHEIERLFLTDRDDLLKFAQGGAVLPEIVAELVLYQNELDVVFINDVHNPIPQGVCGKVKCRDAFLCGQTEYVVHKGRYIAALFQGIDNLIRRRLRES